MANALINLITQISGFENFERCLRLCDIIESSELININENTLDRMELYLQKKCSKMPSIERNQFIGEKFACYPDIFKFSPAVRQRILSITERLSKMFANPTLPITAGNVNDICNKILLHNKTPLTTISSNCLRMMAETRNIPLPSHKTVSQQSPPVVNKLSQENIKKQCDSEAISTNDHSGKENYPNIFQRMDSLRAGAISSTDKTKPEMENKITVPDNNNRVPESTVVISSVTTRSQRLCNKRPVDYCVDQTDEPTPKKAKKTSNAKKPSLSPAVDKLKKKPIQCPVQDSNITEDKSPINEAPAPLSAEAVIRIGNIIPKSPEQKPHVEKPMPAHKILKSGPSVPPTANDTERPPQQPPRKLQLSDCLFQQTSSTAANAKHKLPQNGPAKPVHTARSSPIGQQRQPIITKKPSQPMAPPKPAKPNVAMPNNKFLIRRVGVANGPSTKPAAPIEIVAKTDSVAPAPTVDDATNKGLLVVTPPHKLPVAVTKREFNFAPQWTSTPNFIANRFINSTKHQNRQSQPEQRPQMYRAGNIPQQKQSI